LQIWSFFRHNRPFYWADLDADATVNTGGKVNPVPVSTLDIFARTFVDTSNRAGINAISDAFTGISNNSMGHCSLKDLGITSGLSLLFLAYQDSAVTSSPTAAGLLTLPKNWV
jgi:hypothetical protein